MASVQLFVYQRLGARIMSFFYPFVTPVSKRLYTHVLKYELVLLSLLLVSGSEPRIRFADPFCQVWEEQALRSVRAREAADCQYQHEHPEAHRHPRQLHQIV